MLPIKHKWIFRSRWIALLWAAGICWTAVDVAGSKPGGSPDAPANGADDGARQAGEITAAANALDAIR